MPDPVVSQITSGTSATATTTISFTAQPAGTLLLLAIGADDYTTGTPSGWTLSTGCSQQTYLGTYLYWKIATGAETSVAYTIGSAAPSCYALVKATNIDTTSTLDISNGQNQVLSAAAYTTPAVTSTSGRRCAVAVIGFADAGRDTTGMGTWLSSFTEVSDVRTTVGSGTQDAIGVAYLVFDGGGSVSSGATIEGGDSLISAACGITAVFKVSTAGSTYITYARRVVIG